MVHRLGTVAGADIEQCAYCRICHSISVYLLDTEVWVGHSRNALMLWAFFLGLAVDVFSDTPGMNAAATVLLAFLRPTFLRLFVPRDTLDTLVPYHPYNGDSSFPEISGCECADTSRLVAYPRILLFCPYWYAVVENCGKYPAYCDLHYGCWGNKKERIKGLRIRNWWKTIHWKSGNM